MRFKHAFFSFTQLSFGIVFFGSLLVGAQGCASILATPEAEVPNPSQFALGTPRAVIESKLGLPISEERADVRSGADKKAVYRYYVRNSVENERSTYEKLVDSMVSFREEVLTIYYGRDQRLLRMNVKTERS